MAHTHPKDERQRLAEFYAAMTDGELGKLAAEADSLTHLAREALETEIDRRQMDELPEPAPAPRSEIALRDLVTIRQFRDLPEALLAKGFVESAGIQCFLADDNLVRLDWFISNFIGGIKLQVDADDAAAALEILDQPIPEDFDIEGVGEYRQPRCPRCYSLDISFEELNKSVAYTSAYFGVPIPLQRQSWKCHTCGSRWQNDDSADVKER